MIRAGRRALAENLTDSGGARITRRRPKAPMDFPHLFAELTMLYDATLLDTIGRLLIVASFLVAGVCNMTPARDQGSRRPHGGVREPLPAAAFWIGIAIQFTGSARCSIVGWHADVGAILLIVFTVLRYRSATPSSLLAEARPCNAI